MRKYEKPFDVYELRQLIAEDPNGFIEKLKNVLLNEGAARAVALIKISGICYCVYGENKKDSLFRQAVKLFVDIDEGDNAEIKRLLYEVSCLDDLFKDFYSLMKESGVNTILRDSEVPYFLLACESTMCALLEYISGADWKIIENKYPVAKKPVNHERKPLAPVNDAMQLSYVYEGFVGHIGKVLTYFYYHDASFKGANTVLLKDKLEISSRHLQLFELFASLCLFYESWMHVNCRLIKKDEEIHFDPIDDDQYLDSQISLDRFNHLKNQDTAEFIKIIKDFEFQPTATALFPKGLRSYTEVFSGFLCEDLLGSYGLKENILGVTIAEWLRAFSIILENGIAFIKNRNAGARLTVSDWCILRDKSDWVCEFEKGGVAAKSASIIIDNLIFYSGAEDILDCPFIRFEDKLLCIPSAITSLDAAQSLLSNLSDKNIDISFKGKNFEDTVIKIVNNADILGFSLYEKDGDQEYECDLTFLISDELYFVECKSFTQPRTPREYYELLVKAYSATKQLSRISEYFLNRSRLLKKKFKKQEEWRPQKIHKIILSKANITPAFMNESIVIDSSTFIRFFKRDKVTIVKGSDKAVIYDSDSDGPITNEKFISYIHDPIHIKLMKENRIKKEVRIRIRDHILRFPKYVEKVPFYSFYEDKEYEGVS
jgi:hypothetical protein